MIIFTRRLDVETNAMADEGFIAVYNLTPKIQEYFQESRIQNGTLTVFIPATTASIAAIEFEAGLISDFKKIWTRLVPRDIVYTHKFLWEENNGYSHVRASMLGPSLVVPMVSGRLVLGQYQQIVLFEFDNRSRTRQIVLQFIGAQ
jgi:secondary thiamine-phosphate synthase enzyme